MAADSETPDSLPDEWLFRCDVIREGETATLRPAGDLDMLAVPAISAQVTELRESGCRRLVIDLRELDFLDSSGLRFLLDACAEARQDGSSIALIRGRPAVQRVFELTGTTEQLPFVES